MYEVRLADDAVRDLENSTGKSLKEFRIRFDGFD